MAPDPYLSSAAETNGGPIPHDASNRSDPDIDHTTRSGHPTRRAASLSSG
jgi:hypothetical protein